MTRKTRAAFPAWAVLFLCVLLFQPKTHANYGSTITKTLTTGAGGAQFTENLAGQLTQRSFPDSSHENFAYNSAGAATTWTTPRATLALTPNVFGQPTTFGSVGSLSYDLAGRVNWMSTAADTTTQSYVDGQPDVESHTAGVLKGQSVDRDYDTLGRLWKVKLPGDVTIIYSYDTATGALSGVTTAGGASGTWSNFDPVTGKAKNFTLGPLTVTGSFDGLGRVKSHVSTAAGQTVAYNDYRYDADGHCYYRNTPNGAWDFDYDGNGYLHQASSGAHSYTYNFDEAGRPANATDWRPTVRLNSSVIDVFGSVTPGATLTINSGTVAVDGTTGRFSASYTPTTNSWQTYVVRGTVVGAGNNGTDAVAEEVRNIFVPPASENLGYDLSGNLSSDARWTMGWDALDRMTSMDEATPLSPSTKMRTDFQRDLKGRCVETKVSVGGVVKKRTVTLWDGWLPVMDIDYIAGSYELARRYYTWGPDVSGRLDGAAGIGGLLEILEKKGGTTTRSLPISDGIGNVVGLVDGTTGARVATFSYGPFGEVIEAWGERANSCPFRFQTKRYSQETGLYDFVARPYDPKMRTWLSRDPLREDGGVNLFAYCSNRPVGNFDPIGLADWGFYEPAWYERLYGDYWNPGYAEAKANDAIHVALTGQRISRPSYAPIRDLDSQMARDYENGVDTSSADYQEQYRQTRNAAISHQMSLARHHQELAQPAFDAIEAFAMLAPIGLEFAEAKATASLGRMSGSTRTKSLLGGKTAPKRVSNPLPANGVFSRVMPREFAEAFARGEGSLAGSGEVFIGAADDLAGITTKSGAQLRLSLFNDAAGTAPNLAGDTMVTFRLRSTEGIGLSSPIQTVPSRGYGFTLGGRTGGGAREWLINNGTAGDLGIYDIQLSPLR